MKTSIATVCLSGTLEEKLVAASEAGFDGVEIFEPDLVSSPVPPARIRATAADLGLTLDLYQPFRDFEGVGTALLEANLRRAGAKFRLMNDLGIDTMLLCSNVSTAKSGDDSLAAEQLHALGGLAAEHGVRVAYEALAWGRFVSDFEHAARIVRLADHPSIGNCLDSFHILSRGWSPEAIEAIPGDRIFFVQLADAPQLAMDVLSWSRHHRVFPGEGDFDLAAFLGHVLKTGYSGPVSLEVFNDVFRQTDPRPTAVDALRSLRWLQETAADWLAHEGATAAVRTPLASLPRAEQPENVEFIELRTGDRPRLRAMLEQLGFDDYGAHRSKSVELWSQGSARVVLSDRDGASTESDVAAVGFAVADIEASRSRAEALGAPTVARERRADEADLLGVLAPDGTEIFYGASTSDGRPAWVDEFGGAREEPSPGHVSTVDHVNLAQPWQHFDASVLFFRSALALGTQPALEVAAPRGLVRSQVLRSDRGGVRLILNLAPPGAGVSRAQHVAFLVDDALAVAREAVARGLTMLPIPANYYDDITARFDLAPERVAELQSHDLLYDRDATGEFLHFYTEAVGDLFFEVVERRGRYDGYGAANAPIRLAAQQAALRSVST